MPSRRHPYADIGELVAHAAGGSTLHDVAIAAHALSVEIGIPVSFIHNDRQYEVNLEIKQIAGPEPPKENR